MFSLYAEHWSWWGRSDQYFTMAVLLGQLTFHHRRCIMLATSLVQKQILELLCFSQDGRQGISASVDVSQSLGKVIHRCTWISALNYCPSCDHSWMQICLFRNPWRQGCASHVRMKHHQLWGCSLPKGIWLLNWPRRDEDANAFVFSGRTIGLWGGGGLWGLMWTNSQIIKSFQIKIRQ
jgi:hypothetical protein